VAEIAAVRILLAVIATLLGIAVIPKDHDVPKPPAPTINVAPPRPAPRPTTTTSTTVVTDDCGDVIRLARLAGWPEQELVNVRRVAYRESRCLSHIDGVPNLNALDPAGGSIGPMQVNLSWAKPNRYYPYGYLQGLGIGVDGPEDLADPLTNLRAAYEVWKYAHNKHGNGWLPWNLNPYESD